MPKPNPEPTEPTKPALTQLNAPAPEEPKPEPPLLSTSTVTKPQMEEATTDGQYYSCRQLSTMLGFSLVYVSRLVKSGRIKAIKPTGSQWRIPKSEYQRIAKEGLPPMPRENKAIVHKLTMSEEQRNKVLPEKKEKGQTETTKERGFFPFDFSLFGKS